LCLIRTRRTSTTQLQLFTPDLPVPLLRPFLDFLHIRDKGGLLFCSRSSRELVLHWCQLAQSLEFDYCYDGMSTAGLLAIERKARNLHTLTLRDIDYYATGGPTPSETLESAARYEKWLRNVLVNNKSTLRSFEITGYPKGEPCMVLDHIVPALSQCTQLQRLCISATFHLSRDALKPVLQKCRALQDVSINERYNSAMDAVLESGNSRVPPLMLHSLTRCLARPAADNFKRRGHQIRCSTFKAVLLQAFARFASTL